MYKSHATKLNLIEKWSRQWIRENNSKIISSPREERMEVLMNAIKEALYSGYSEWANDYDDVERIARRILE